MNKVDEEQNPSGQAELSPLNALESSAIDHPESPYIWVRDLLQGSVASTCFSDESESYWSGRVEVVENSNNGRNYKAGQRLFVRVGAGTPWFWRPRQYEQDRRSMFIQPCHVIAIESDNETARQAESVQPKTQE